MTYNDGRIHGIARQPIVYSEQFMDLPDDDEQFDGIMEPADFGSLVRESLGGDDDEAGEGEDQ